MPEPIRIIDGVPTMVVSTSVSIERSSERAHARMEFGVEIHPDVDTDEVKLRLIQTVMNLNRELQEKRRRRDS